ncbi:MAG: GGDEF domain-containing protein [Tissierellaceae bacterium]|nr:GGDEF domain-containing protein [Tissierellaceae bacterium]
MTNNFVSFLVQCDKELNIVNTHWYNPVHLISPFQKKLADLFDPDEIGIIEESAQYTLNNNEIYNCNSSFTLRSPQVEVSLCMMSMDDKVLILGIENGIFECDSTFLFFRDIVHEFMNVLKSFDTNLVTENERTIQFQFEQIQKLNNNLLNTQRQLKKANSELNRLNTKLHNRLVEDALTGLVSRYQYIDEIQLTINKSPNKLGIFTFIDIDSFKNINDTHGHRAGDEFLIEFANRLKLISFENPICIRISGDEFGLYLHGYDTVDKNHILAIWEEIQRKILSKPIEVGYEILNVFCSAGMAIYNKDTNDIFDLIEYADFAMYQAKESGKNNYRQFNAEEYKEKKHKK